jgi:hypothetical protein
MWALPSFKRRKVSETNILFHNVFVAKGKEREFHTQAGARHGMCKLALIKTYHAVPMPYR